jgi:hypothetical protein
MAIRVVLVKAFGPKTASVDGMIRAPPNAGYARSSHAEVDAAPNRHMPHVDGTHRSIRIASSCCDKHRGSMIAIPLAIPRPAC